MITFFGGTPGSGKSYEAVKKILDNLKSGRTVYTNIDGLDVQENHEIIKMYTGLDDFQLQTQFHYLHYDKVPNFWKYCSSGSLIVLDEIQKVFSSREWQSDKNKEFAAWASTHRHHGFDVILISQAIERIDVAVRSIVEWSYIFRKVNFFGSLISNSYLKYAYSGDDVSGKSLAMSRHPYDRKIFNCYHSYVSKDIKEVGIMKHANVLKHPIFYAIPVVVGLFIWQLSHSSIFSGKFMGVGRPGVPSAVAAVVPRLPSNLPVVPSGSVVGGGSRLAPEDKHCDYPSEPLSSVAPVAVPVPVLRARLDVDRHNYSDVQKKCDLSLSVKTDRKTEMFVCDYYRVFAVDGVITESYRFMQGGFADEKKKDVALVSSSRPR